MNEYTQFVVTGVLFRGKRFRSVYDNSKGTGAFWAFSVNLYRGSVWGVLPNGKRKLLKRVS